MNKFTLQEPLPITDETSPVLYKVVLGNRYYLHKGKTLKESAERFLEDIFRGMRNKSCPIYYANVVDYCNLHPQIYKASIEVLFNGEPDKLLKKESALLKANIDNIESLNRRDMEPYKPEWMIKQSLQKRCEICIPFGFVGNENACFAKRLKFKFCPNCGRLNK